VTQIISSTLNSRECFSIANLESQAYLDCSQILSYPNTGAQDFDKDANRGCKLYYESANKGLTSALKKINKNFNLKKSSHKKVRSIMNTYREFFEEAQVPRLSEIPSQRPISQDYSR